MKRRRVFLHAVAIVAAGWLAPDAAHAQPATPLGGIWSLNRAASEFPRDIGFDIDLPALDGEGQARETQGRRRANPVAPRRESYEDGQRMRILLGEVRNPPSRLTIVDTPAAVTITNDLGQSRTFHPNGREESIEAENIPITVTATREADRLVVQYHVEQDRDVRWTYSPSAGPARRLTVEAQLLERGKGDKVRRIYDPGLAPAPPSPASTSAAPPAGAGQPARETFDQRPGAEFAGIKSVGVLVEELGPEARACGLRQDAIEDALARRLTAGGLTVRKNSDEDTYVYVNVITTNVANGTCVSRYDAFLYTHATARLTYRDRPVLVQVSLMHRGGIGTSAAAVHPASVVRGLEGYVDLFVTQIREASNK